MSAKKVISPLIEKNITVKERHQLIKKIASEIDPFCSWEKLSTEQQHWIKSCSLEDFLKDDPYLFTKKVLELLHEDSSI